MDKNTRKISSEIYFDTPNITALEKEYLLKALETGFVSSIGPMLDEIQKKFAEYLKVDKAIATQSGTAALHMAYKEAGIGEGDEVIVPVTTFIATVNPVVYCGATPVFVDIDPHTWNIDPKQIAKAVTKKTKAIVPVHLYGNPCDMTAILKIAARHKLVVVEDATESLGAVYGGQFTGTFGEFGCFSFSGNKTITSGDGGMIIGKNLKKLEHIRYLVNQAKDVAGGYFHSEIGYKYNMTNIQAGLGLAQMERLCGFLKIKLRINKIYKKFLNGVDGVEFQQEYAGAKSSVWLTSVRFTKRIDIEALQRTLREKKIPTKRLFVPIIEFPPYKPCKRSECPTAHELYGSVLCLPSATKNAPAQIEYVARTLKKILVKQGY